jgi:hypothetical protein
MPVKAAPVQYVKICSLYGDGFYYIPGTDTCLKLGGYLRVQAEYNMGAGGIAIGSGPEATQGKFTRTDTNDINFRTRAALSWDVRQQTEYGTLRTYIRVGVQQTTPADVEGGVVFWDRAFMQFAGFTVGKTQSFFDLFTYGGAYSYHNVRVSGDTGAAGITVWAYTAQFGNGFSGTLSLESLTGHNRMPVVDASVANFFAINGALVADTAFGIQTAANNGFRMPDVVVNLRVDQAWGFAGISGAIHEATGQYWNAPLNPFANNVGNGHPNDKLGWALAAGAKFNLQGGDMIGFNACYSEGAAGFCTNEIAFQLYNASSTVGVGLALGRHLRCRHRGPAHPGVERACRVRAHLEPEVENLVVRRLRGRQLQRHREEHHQLALAGRESACRGLRSADRCDKPSVAHHGHSCRRQQLQPELQLLRSRFAHAVEPGAAARYRPRSALHQAQHCLQGSGHLRDQPAEAGHHRLRRPGSVVGDVPLAA